MSNPARTFALALVVAGCADTTSAGKIADLSQRLDAEQRRADRQVVVPLDPHRQPLIGRDR